MSDVVSVLHLQAGNINTAGAARTCVVCWITSRWARTWCAGFAPSGIGPRDLTPGTTNDSLGGSMYWGASLEAQTPLYFLPKEIGIKVAAYCGCRLDLGL